MAQLFHPSANTIAKASIGGAVLLVAILGCLAMGYDRSTWHTDVGNPRTQPVPFSHEHHVRGLGLDCRYCHTSVEDSHFAGIPPTKTCMTCHSQIWPNAAILQPVRDSWTNNRPIQWQRVHNLPEFVYFNHSIHVAKGIGCSTCHGRIDKMPITFQVNSLQMQWCLECHRNPEKFIRPKDQVYNMEYDTALPGQEAIGSQLVKDYHIHKEQLTNCSICHR